MSESKTHSALELPIEERKDYLRVLAALASVDNRIDAEELGVLGELCDALGVTGSHRAEIVDFTRKVDEERVERICASLKGSPLRFSLVTDLLYMAQTDREYTLREREVVESIARYLGIEFRQLDAMEQFADGALRSRVSRLPADERGDNADFDRSANTAAVITAVLAPIAVVVWLGGGTGTQAISLGLDDLGMRQGAGLGVVVAVLLSAALFFLVRTAVGVLVRRRA
jgi:uncharacterized tellurite resistance protein B-like protein